MTKTKKLTGLSEAEVAKALKKYGFNELEKKQQWTAFKVLFRQLTNVIVWILIIASGISYYIGEELNFWVINFIIAFVIVMGFIQEYKAEKVMEALKGIIKPTTKVIRDGTLINIEVRSLVPGDILSLEMGDQVPADAELLEANNLDLDEAQLTGESASVRKKQGDKIYAGTQIVYGRCYAKVKNIGMKTKLGSIASMVQEKEEVTPLQEKMDRLGKLLAIIALFITAIILGMGVVKGVPPTQMLIVALALAVAAVPEGLPLTMTLALSFGMHKMAKKNAVVRRMMAVETLGSTTVICTDKTGTLTRNEMTVQKIFVDNKVVKVSGVGYKPTGEFTLDKVKVKPLSNWKDFFESAMLCNNANLRKNSNGRFEPIGDPTEVALITLGEKAGINHNALEDGNERVEEIFFTSSRKMMTTIHKTDGIHKVCSKGAPEVILERCQYQMINGKKQKLSTKEKEAILKQNQAFGKNALRVLAIATKEYDSKAKPREVEKDLVFLGLVAMRDPARQEVAQAVQTAKAAGVRIIMITGDNPQTALSISKQIGLANGDSKVLTGQEISSLSDKELKEALETVNVLARTQPEDKLRVVEALKEMDQIVAMTGDGVNDAPALKKADIGIAMGIKGTDVSKQASDMILQDDNFATIVTAIEEGRRIYQNIEKFTGYLISRNFTEVILIFMGIIFFDFEFLPLLALQILFINAFDEEMPAIGLGLDQAHGDLMQRPPRSTKEHILNKGNAMIVFSVAAFMALISFFIFIAQDPLNSIEKARTMVFATIVTMVIVDTYNFRSLRQSIRVTGIFNNRFLLFAVGIITAVTLFIMYHAPSAKIFSLVPLEAADWLICVVAALTVVVYMETLKFFRRRIEAKA